MDVFKEQTVERTVRIPVSLDKWLADTAEKVRWGYDAQLTLSLYKHIEEQKTIEFRNEINRAIGTYVGDTLDDKAEAVESIEKADPDQLAKEIIQAVAERVKGL